MGPLHGPSGLLGGFSSPLRVHVGHIVGMVSTLHVKQYSTVFSPDGLQGLTFEFNGIILRLYWGYTGILEKKMETTVMYIGIIGYVLRLGQSKTP